MRRIVVEMGYWLAPSMKDEPLPVLTEWERTADLTALHNKAYGQGTRFEVGKSVLERMELERPRRDHHQAKHGGGGPMSAYDRKVAEKAREQFYRLDDTQRTVIEREREEAKKAEVEAKRARMKEVEVALRPILAKETLEQQAARREEAKRLVAEQDAQAAAAAEAARVKHERMLASKHLSDEERKRKHAERERERKKRKRAEAREAKGLPPYTAPVKPETRPALNLEPMSPQIPAIEQAMQYPLDELMRQHLERQVAVKMRDYQRKGKPMGEGFKEEAWAYFKARQEESLNADPMFLYKWKAGMIEHNRFTTIIMRELNRGSITKAEVAELRRLHGPGDKDSVKRQPPEKRAEHHKAKRAEYRAKYKAKKEAK